jgi:hypothetical protein
MNYVVEGNIVSIGRDFRKFFDWNAGALACIFVIFPGHDRLLINCNDFCLFEFKMSGPIQGHSV